MLPDVDLAQTAALIGDRTRARLLLLLLGGGSLSATDLARSAGVAPATASQHLSRLLDGRLVEVTAVGRHRFYSLAGAEVAAALETLAVISPGRPVRSLRQANAGQRLREARSCYDHLAGRLGVLIGDRLIAEGVIAPLPERGIGELLEPRHPLLTGLGLSVPPAPSARRRPLLRGCLDWTERRPHVAGHLGRAILDSLLGREWLARHGDGRALRVTPEGEAGLAAVLGVEPAVLCPTAA